MNQWEDGDPSARDTLVECPDCQGKGRHLFERDAGRYCSLVCPWCSGLGGVTKAVYARYIRWKEIASAAGLTNRRPTRKIER
jgi:hypothetical protein